MPITIYGDRVSGNCLKVKWVCERLAIPFVWKDVDILKSESRTPDFLAMNTAGQVPVILREDGRALAQSNAIIIHLAEGSDLIPADAYERAQMLEWLFWEQYSHEPYVAVARFQVKYLGKPVADLDAKLVERGAGALQRLEDGLAGRDWLVGGQITLADIALVAYTRWAHEGGFDLAHYPAVKAWVARVEAALPITD